MVVRFGKHKVHALDAAMFVASVAWLGFQIFMEPANRPPTLNEAFLLILGAWVTSKSIEQRKQEQKTEDRVAEVHAKVVELQEQSDATTSRADRAEERERGWSKHRDHSDEEEL